MEDTLIALLETFKYPVIRQGSLGDDEAYPDTFFTFWNNSEDGDSFYDNETIKIIHTFNVNVYSTDPDTVYTLLRSARDLLKTNGWIPTMMGYDIASDEITHTGRGMELTYLEYKQEVQTNG